MGCFSSRLRTLSLIALTGVCTPVLESVARTHQATPIQDLEAGKSVDGVLASGQTLTFRVSLTAGDFVHIVAEQHLIDLSVELVRPDGSVRAGGSLIGDLLQPEQIVLIADVTGSWTVRLSSAYPRQPAGRYVLRLEAARPPTSADRDRLQAEQAFEAGRVIQIRGVQTDFPKGIDTFRNGRDRFHALGDREGELKCLLELAWLEMQLARPEAMDSARTAEQLAAELRDDGARAKAIRIRGMVLERRDVDTALQAFDDSRALYHVLGNEDGEAQLLNEIGLLYGRMGDSDRALVHFERALEIFRRRNSSQQFGVLNNVGLSYKRVGEYDRALAVYQEVLASPGLEQNRGLYATVLTNVGNLDYSTGRLREAVAIHSRVLAIAREVGNKDAEARSLIALGEAYFSLTEYDKALDVLQQSLALSQSMKDISGEAGALATIGRAEAGLNHPDRAEAAFTQSLSLLQSIREEQSVSRTLGFLASLDRERGHPDVALDRARAAVDLDEQLRERITSPPLRASYVASELDEYELYIDLLQQQDAAAPGAGHASEALQVSERAHARVLLESLLDARVDLRQGIDPELLAKERSLQEQLSSVSTEISRALAASDEKTPPANLARTLERLTGEYQQHLAVIRQQSPRYADMTQPQPLSTPDIQRTVIDDKTVLLEFEVGFDQSWLWAVTPTTLTTIALPARDQIDAATRALYENVTARQRRTGDTSASYAQRVAAADAAFGARSEAVSAMLFGGIADRLEGEWRGKRLAIVAAGALEYVPFSALPMPNKMRTLISADHEIVNIPSASVLAALRRELAERAPAKHTLAVVADPVFEASDPRVAAFGTRMPAPGASTNETAAKPGDVDESLFVRSGLARLPFSREEADAIAALAGPRQVFKALDFEANRATALSATLADYRIVHFATHGVLDSTRPSLSGLVMSLVDERGRSRDGFIRVHDIYNMHLDADLVVLSACQTALGKDIRGEGLIGLTRAFMYAGAPRVVASLWEVNDLATAELMKKFYAAMLQRHLTPAAALRTAQLQMARDPRWAAPYYWAGFVFQGDWR